MPELTAEGIAQRAYDLNLIDDRQLHEVWGEIGRGHASADDLVAVLLRREMLTNFQLERMLRDVRSGYFYGDYKVLYLVSAGTFARVYRAVHKDTGKIVAVKVLRSRYSEDAEQADHFYREGMVGRSLRHPNIVPIYEAHSDPKTRTHYLVMEFVEGNNLREFLKVRKRIGPEEATRLTIDIAAGLAYAAEKGLYHRDLKLTNILVSSRGQARLVDFGLSTADSSVADDALADKFSQRTIDYAGLERATGARKDDGRSDVYFTGVIYYYMLLGKSPLHETKDRIQRLSKSRFTDVVPIQQADPSIPRVVANVVNKAMALDVDQRYQSAAEMLADLKLAQERLAAGEGDATIEAAAAAAKPAQLARFIPASQRRSLMVVESNIEWQDALREALKKGGYRVLVTNDPDRALARFEDDAATAECLVFCASQLGVKAIDAFCKFATDAHTASIPAIVLLDATKHPEWVRKIKPLLGSTRVAIPMPVKMNQLRALLGKLVPPLAAT